MLLKVIAYRLSQMQLDIYVRLVSIRFNDFMPESILSLNVTKLFLLRSKEEVISGMMLLLNYFIAFVLGRISSVTLARLLFDRLAIRLLDRSKLTKSGRELSQNLLRLLPLKFINVSAGLTPAP
jgi:hypothetical protein